MWMCMCYTETCTEHLNRPFTCYWCTVLWCGKSDGLWFGSPWSLLRASHLLTTWGTLGTLVNFLVLCLFICKISLIMPFFQEDDTTTCNPTPCKALAHCEHSKGVWHWWLLVLMVMTIYFQAQEKKYSQRYQCIMQILSSHISKKTEMLSFSYSIIRLVTFSAYEWCSTNIW